MSKNVAIGIAVVLVLIILGWYFTQPKQTVPPIPTETATPTPSPEASMSANMISITSTGFKPQAITVKVGDSVAWKNTDSADHTVNSDPHPTHTLYLFLNLGVIKPGESKSVILNQAGTFSYHDHLNPSSTGSITVQ